MLLQTSANEERDLEIDLFGFSKTTLAGQNIDDNDNDNDNAFRLIELLNTCYKY